MYLINTDNYPIYINANYDSLNDFISEIGYTKLVIIVDEHTQNNCLPYLRNKFKHDFNSITIPPGEAHKNIDIVGKVWKQLLDLNLDRKSIIINLGGGLIGDLGGFVASTYMRGVRFIQIPTSLLAQVDASVGGKTGINHTHIKNAVGAFNNPSLVWIDTNFLSTLPERQLRSGYAEMLKHGLIQDPKHWQALTSKENLWKDIAHHPSLIKDSILIKHKVVQADPLESGLRKILNYGHTLGHAIESYYLNTAHPLTHGEAIAIGMVTEAYLSHKLLNLTAAQAQDIKTKIKSIYSDLPLQAFDFEDLSQYLIRDKKNESESIKFALLDNIGECLYNCETDTNTISEALKFWHN